MSVLYKALQKAEKENERRQSASQDSGFDPQRLTASGALKFAGTRGRAPSRILMAAIGVVAVGAGAAFIIFEDALSPTPVAPAMQTVEMLVPPPVAEESRAEVPPARQSAAATAPESVPAAMSDAPSEPESASASSMVSPPQEAAVASAALPKAAPPAAAADPTETQPVQTEVAMVPKATPKPAASEVSRRAEPMPTLAADSPARMLSPPIAIKRSEFEIAGVGDQVRVREVSQGARNNVSAGYDALVRGSYDMAIGFYDAALKDEPNSALALLGRGAALQKLGRGADAQAAYEQVLKLDPQNREALTNITGIVAERAPQEALTRLLELERQYPAFSPIKAQIGLIYAKTGSMEPALDYLRRAAALSPDAVLYQYNLALVLDRMGRREQAAGVYDAVLAAVSGGRGTPGLSVIEIERRVRFLRAR